MARGATGVKLNTGSFSTSSCGGLEVRLKLLAGITSAARSTLLRPESATFDLILRLDLAWVGGLEGWGQVGPASSFSLSLVEVNLTVSEGGGLLLCPPA